MASRIPNTHQLAAFLAELRYDAIPSPVIERTKDLFLDWLASALAGKGSHPIPVFERYVQKMGPQSGPSTMVANRRSSSAYFAAFINAASSHLVEQDDLHNSSVLHPGTVVFPAALAAAQDLGKSGAELLLASVAGYEAGIRIGEFLGRSHYRVFHTTGTAGTLAAAVAVAKLHGFDTEQMIETLGSAGTQAAGLWEFLRDAADSKQLHTAKAAADGLLAAYMTADHLRGARNILEGPQGMAAGMSQDADPTRLVDGLGRRWATIETSFKFHSSCRHTHPAADALLLLMQREQLTYDDIDSVTAHVHQAAIDVLGEVHEPSTVHQAKFSMGTVLGLIAVYGRAGLDEFKNQALQDPRVAAFRQNVTMVLDKEVDHAYPKRWVGRITVVTSDGRSLSAEVNSPKGDPDNTLSRAELEEKMYQLVRFSGAATDAETRALIDKVWQLETLPDLKQLLPSATEQEDRHDI